MQKVNYFLIAAASVLLSACNITKVNLAYCPASTTGAYTTHTLKVGKVYDDRHNTGDLTNDPREIGEFSWSQSIAPSIYYGKIPIVNTFQTSMNMSLQKAGYKLTSVHPDVILFTRIDKVDLNVEGKNNLEHTLFCRITADYALVAAANDDSIYKNEWDAQDKVLWKKTIQGEASVDVHTVHSQEVKKVFTGAMDDAFVQLERNPGFNRALR
jgi:hypothetical protein